MNEIVGYTYDGGFYCPVCIHAVKKLPGGLAPVYNTDEYSDYPTCDGCGDLIQNVSLVYTEKEEVYLHTLFYGDESEAQRASEKVLECFQGVNEVVTRRNGRSWCVLVSCGCKADLYDERTAVIKLRPIAYSFNIQEVQK